MQWLIVLATWLTPSWLGVKAGRDGSTWQGWQWVAKGWCGPKKCVPQRHHPHRGGIDTPVPMWEMLHDRPQIWSGKPLCAPYKKRKLSRSTRPIAVELCRYSFDRSGDLRTRHRTEGGSFDLSASGYPHLRSVGSPNAKRMAEMDVHVRTLSMVMRTMPTLSALVPKNGDTEHNEAMIIALWTSAVIQYARCFDSSYGKGLPANKVFSDIPELLEHHEEVMTVRSKHLAHDVNSWRLADVSVQVFPDGELGELVRPFVFRIPSADEATLLLLLLSRAHTYALAERMALKKAVVGELRKKTVAERLSLPELRYEEMHTIPIKRARRT